MTKRLPPERIAEYRHGESWSLVMKCQLLSHIDAIEAELAVEKQRGLDLLAAGIREGAELAEAKAEIARLKERLDQWEARVKELELAVRSVAAGHGAVRTEHNR